MEKNCNTVFQKDTANPLSHQVMASLYRSSFTQALAPKKKNWYSSESTIISYIVGCRRNTLDQKNANLL